MSIHHSIHTAFSFFVIYIEKKRFFCVGKIAVGTLTSRITSSAMCLPNAGTDLGHIKDEVTNIQGEI